MFGFEFEGALFEFKHERPRAVPLFALPNEMGTTRRPARRSGTLRISTEDPAAGRRGDFGRSFRTYDGRRFRVFLSRYRERRFSVTGDRFAAFRFREID